jgi:hypothetical protein
MLARVVNTWEHVLTSDIIGFGLERLATLFIIAVGFAAIACGRVPRVSDEKLLGKTGRGLTE